MSVPTYKRKESPLQVYETARTLRKNITNIFLKRFCNDNLYCEKVVTENGTHIVTTEKYPAYLVEFIRKTILGLLQKLMQNITMANAIYPTRTSELEQRIALQNNVIGIAESLYSELNYCADIFPQQLGCLLSISDEVDKLVKSARKWKRANNKIEKRIKGCCSVATNFANVNNDGSANNNNASNTNNGVSPDLIDLQ